MIIVCMYSKLLLIPVMFTKDIIQGNIDNDWAVFDYLPFKR